MTQSQVLIVQHVPWEKPGRILDNLDDLNMSSTVVNIAKEKKPDLPDFGAGRRTGDYGRSDGRAGS